MDIQILSRVLRLVGPQVICLSASALDSLLSHGTIVLSRTL